jgi:hypothetical protein
MKRLTLLLVLFLTLGLTATFALDVEPSWSGDATLTWGVDLDAKTTGFKNEATGSVTLTFLDGEGVEAAGDGTVFGKISLADATIGLDSTSTDVTASGPDVTAWVYIGPAWIQIYTAPDMAFDKAEDAEGLDAVAGDDLDNSDYTGNGFTLGVTLGPADVEVYVVSDGDWAANVSNGYAAGLMTSIAAGPADIGVYGVYGFNYGVSYIGFGLSTDLTLELGAMGLVFGVGADFRADGGVFDYEAAAGTTLELAYNDDGDAVTTFGVDFSYSPDFSETDLAVAFSEASGFVDGLTFDVGVVAAQLTSGNPELDVDVSGSYDINGIVPGFSVGYDMNVISVNTDDVLDANVNLVLGGLVPLTTFTLDWTAPQLLDTMATVQDIGEFTFATNVAYE